MTFITRPRVASPTGTVIGPREIDGLHPARQPVGRVHGHAPDDVLAQVLLDLDDDVHRERSVEALARDADGGIDLGELHPPERDVDDGPDDLDDDPVARLVILR